MHTQRKLFLPLPPVTLARAAEMPMRLAVGWRVSVMKTEISGQEAARVAEDMAKPGPIRAGSKRAIPELMEGE